MRTILTHLRRPLRLGPLACGAALLTLLALGHFSPAAAQTPAPTPWTADGADIYNTNSGNVGVGTQTPSGRLEVQGPDGALVLSQAGFATKNAVQVVLGKDLHLSANAMYAAGGWARFDTTVPAWNLMLSTVADHAAIRRASAGANPLTWTELLIVKSSGNVGIGTPLPTSKLHLRSNTSSATSMLHLDTGVAGGTALAVGASAAGESTFDLSVNRPGGYVSRFGVSAAGHIYLQPGGSGNVGVGTSAPTFRLDVRGGQVNASGGLCIAGDCKASWDEVTAGVNPWSASGTSISYGGGAVGLGTASPSSPLEVQAPEAAITLSQANVAGKATVQTATGTSIHLGANAKYAAGSWSRFDAALPSWNIFASPNSDYMGVRRAAPAAGTITWSDYLRITGAGNVILGTVPTTAPTERLYVAGDVKAAGDLSVTGSLGVGTSAPNSALELRAGNAFAGTSSAGSGTNLGNLVVLSTDAQGANVGGMLSLGGSRGSGGMGVFGGVRGAKENSTDGSTAGYLAFYTLQPNVAFAERMRVASNGNVGVGTTSPSAKLDVAGQVRSSSGGFVFPDGSVQATAAAGAAGWTDSGTSVTLTNSADSVGIGGAPAGLNRLHVHGDVKVEGTLRGGVIEAQYQDVAEWVASSQELSPGTVVVLDAERANHVLASAAPYDTRVAGVVSARPGLILGRGGAGRYMVATTGRVKVRVDATRAPIKVGDLLVTGDVKGLAMKSIPIDLGGTPIHRPGTIIGKALEPLAQGTGEILVLLSLQ